MDKLIKTLPAILESPGASDEFAEAACLIAWKHTVGEGLINHAVALRLQQKTLVVAVADKIWQTQLEQMRGQLLFRLNSILGQPLVTSIELLVDPVALTMFVQNVKPPEVSNQGKLNEDVISFELRSAASAIEDSRLRTAFLGAASSCLNRLEKSKT